MHPRWLAGVLVAALVGAAAIGACGGGSSGFGGDAGGGGDGASDDSGNLLGGDGAGQSLDVEPKNATLIVTPPAVAKQQFQAYAPGSSTPVQAQWTVDSGSIGTIDATGLFTASGTVAGKVTIEAQSGGLQGKAVLSVVLHLSDNPGNVPPATQQQLLGGGNADPTFAWLYPYDATVFPRGLLPPTLQLAGTPPDAVLLHVSFSSLDYQGFYGASNPARIDMAPALWTTITESASGTDSVKVEVTKISGGQVTGPVAESWRIAQGSLKGSVYYESRYSSPNDNGATMRIKPGAAMPDVLLGNCTVCHYVSGDGSTLVAELDNGMRTSAAYDLTKAAAVITQKPDESFTLGALFKDGSLVMSGGLGASVGFDGVNPARLFDVKTGMQLAAQGWDGVVNGAVLPSFAPDGKQIVFNRFDVGMGHTLTVMDFDRQSLTFSNMVDVATDPSHYLGWPGFTPDREWILFDVDTEAFLSCIGPCGCLQATAPKADLAVAHVASKTTAPLDLLNGVSGGKVYLPFGEQAEGHMNYQPTVLPVAVGGYYWVVFTSRREYGNLINTADPYYCVDNRTAGAQPWRKKLWVAALDIDNPEHPSTTAHDISHPAFYLPGQALQTGNYRGFWALDPCQATGTTCQSGDQCCSGFCRQSTVDGGVVFTCVPPQGCANEYEKCTVDSDCCQASQGYHCINGFCAQPSAQ